MEQIILIFAVIVAAVNVVTEVAKSVHTFGSDQAINGFVVGLSVIFSLGAYSAFWVVSGYAFTWYAIAAFIVGGLLASYAAMFGFDKLIKYFENILKTGE